MISTSQSVKKRKRINIKYYYLNMFKGRLMLNLLIFNDIELLVIIKREDRKKI